MSVTHATTTLNQAQRALGEAFHALEAIGETLNATQRTTVWETVTATLGAPEAAVEEDPARGLPPGERTIGGRRYYSAAWLSDPLTSETS